MISQSFGVNSWTPFTLDGNAISGVSSPTDPPPFDPVAGAQNISWWGWIYDGIFGTPKPATPDVPDKPAEDATPKNTPLSGTAFLVLSGIIVGGVAAIFWRRK